jgi:hypothetical protein
MSLNWTNLICYGGRTRLITRFENALEEGGDLEPPSIEFQWK